MSHDERPIVERIGEDLARRVARRKFLQGSVAAIFGTVAGWAVEGFRVPGAHAAQCYTTTSTFACNPPFGRFCASGNCAGADCISPQCTPNFDAGWPTACWCTMESCQGTNVGYFTCCDCYCGGQACGCVGFTVTGFC